MRLRYSLPLLQAYHFHSAYARPATTSASVRPSRADTFHCVARVQVTGRLKRLQREW